MTSAIALALLGTIQLHPVALTSPVMPQNPPKYRVIARRDHQLKDLERVKITIGEHTFNTWVMDTNSKRMEGMMWVENSDFTEKDAMIFVYNEAFEMNFWMRNTLVDLDIAYVRSDKVIRSIATMKRLDESLVPSRGAAQYAIEFKAGLLKKLGIKAGMKVQMPATLKSKD